MFCIYFGRRVQLQARDSAPFFAMSGVGYQNNAGYVINSQIKD